MIEFNFLPAWAKNSYDTLTVKMTRTDAGYEFHCESADEECVHILPLEDFENFIRNLGENFSEISDPEIAVRKLVEEQRHRDINSAIHKGLKVTYSWRSTNWND